MATPLRAGPRVLPGSGSSPGRTPTATSNGESLVYVQIDNGRWLVDHVQRQARDAYARSGRPDFRPRPARSVN